MALVFLVASCDKTEYPKHSGDATADPLPPVANPSTWNQVDKQIEWIAKGLACNRRDADFLLEVHTIAANNDEAAFMDDIEDEIAANLLYEFQHAHEDSIDNRFLGNTYNRDYLGGFIFNGTDNYTNFVYIPDASTVDTTQQHVVVPYRRWEAAKEDTMTGFFINSSEQLDSVLLIDEEPPTDQYYIWIVMYDHNKTQFEETIRRNVDPGCGNGYCEAGEDSITCPGDCAELSQPPGESVKHLYDIKVKSLEVHRDVHQYMESWAAGKYDFWYAGNISKPGDTVVHSVGEAILSSNGLAFTESNNNFMLQVKRSEVCREKKNGNTKNCPAILQNINKVMYENVTETDSILFLAWEGMNNGNGALNTNEFYVGNPNHINPNGEYPVVYYMTVHRNERAVIPYFSINDTIVYNKSLYPWDDMTGNPTFTPYNQSQFTVSHFNPVTNEYTFDNGEVRVVLELVQL